MQYCGTTTTAAVVYNICAADNHTTSSPRHIFAKSQLFSSWNLYICFLSVLLNLLGNPLIILVIYKTSAMHNFTHYLFVNLAVSDVLLGLSSIVSFAIRETLKEGSEAFSLDWVCKLVHTCPIPAVSMTVSSFTLTVITWERCYHISQPFKARVAQRNTKLVVGIIWAVAVVILIPVLVYTKFVREKHSCVIAVPHLKVYVIFLTFIAFVGPLGLMLYCYYKTVVMLWFSKTDQMLGSFPANRTALRRHRKTVTKFLGVVIISFIVCSVPVAVMLVARRYLTVPNTLFFSTVLLGMFSSSVNPVIFMAQNRQFRNGLKNLVFEQNSLIISNPRRAGSKNMANTIA
ncbi:neuropeptide Y receptor type 1-like [Dendronephthya gigantea]|uniref:neuropeptide Y receptor type 1-like n=1 Tax=Dendronephthya gigantea TaxID=151771 RepID=UPI001069ED91|nr:neuropeptide Y receptor type 1-like [Dendronephthya gigantea]